MTKHRCTSMAIPCSDTRAETAGQGRSETASSNGLAAVAGYFDFGRWTPNGIERGRRAFPEEIPLAVTVNDVEYAVMLATPADIEDFACGFLLTEGLIQDAAEIDLFRVLTRPEGLIAEVKLIGALPEASRRARRIAGVSSCGLCGMQALRDAMRPIARVADGPVFEGGHLLRAMATLRDFQPANAVTGAMHAAAFADGHGTLLCAREDVGRHNALDKLIGALARAGTPADEGFVVTSSRCSYELIQKSAAYGVRLLCTVSAPTALAVRLAAQANMTLVSRARDESFLLLTGHERIKYPDSVERRDG